MINEAAIPAMIQAHDRIMTRRHLRMRQPELLNVVLPNDTDDRYTGASPGAGRAEAMKRKQLNARIPASHSLASHSTQSAG